MKCPDPMDFPFNGTQFEDAAPPDTISPPFDGCVAVGGTLLDGDEDPTCYPGPTDLEPWPSDSVPPTHEGTFTAGAPGTQANVTVNGVTKAVGYDGEFVFSLSNCTGSSQQVCDLELQLLELDLVGAPKFGDYRVDSAVVSLAAWARTTVNFNCTSQCVGTFEFWDSAGTGLTTNLNWEQTTLSTGSVGGGGLPLGADGLASVTRVLGQLQLNLSKTSGTLRLQGQGGDNFGGDLASVTFDLRGPVYPFGTLLSAADSDPELDAEAEAEADQAEGCGCSQAAPISSTGSLLLLGLLGLGLRRRGARPVSSSR